MISFLRDLSCRLSKGSEESPPREVCSGDVLQFGVDVVENWKKVTHGSIIATLKLYLPHGKEAIGAGAANMLSSGGSALLPAQDLYQLNQYIQEALAREQLLETKLAVLQRLVGQTDTASSEAWKSVIDEDRLVVNLTLNIGRPVSTLKPPGEFAVNLIGSCFHPLKGC